MPDASPTKWHLAHTTWFFETFILIPHSQGYREFDADYGYLFNSYYEAVGPRHLRTARGMITRPGRDEVLAYRAHVDDAICAFIQSSGATLSKDLIALFELGFNHEQQHQELLLMDIKHLLSCNPLAPAYRKKEPVEVRSTHPLQWFAIEGGNYEIGHKESGFSFDNEGPSHEILINDFKIGSRCVTNSEYRKFIEDGGYRKPEYWHADGWALANNEQWAAPLYWRAREDPSWDEFTFAGDCPLYSDAPVCHVSFYEASAYATWADKRLPTEFEWEVAATKYGCDASDEETANRLSSGFLRPMPAGKAVADKPLQMTGDVWEWTQSPYTPYPGFKPVSGAVGEYNGKFMVNQMVLRGASCATPAGHARLSYRNFYYPHQRWMFSGFRLAE